MRNETFQFARMCAATALAAACAVAGAQNTLYENIESVAAQEVESKRAAAEQGDADAQYVLANAYWNGRGVAMDKREAVRWYREAAEQGHAEAQLGMGLAYANGDGVSINVPMAVDWYRKAAEQGVARAQLLLGDAYRHGRGVYTDYRKALY